MVTLKLTDQDARELQSLIQYELRESERHYIRTQTLRLLDNQLRDQQGNRDA